MLSEAAPSVLVSPGPVGWRVFRQVSGAFVVSCVLAWVTELPERHLRETLDAVVQSTLLGALDAADPQCTADAPEMPCVTQVEIQPADHAELFERTSPLDPSVLADFIGGLADQAQVGRGPQMVAFDLDMAPVSAADVLRREPLVEALLRLSQHVPVLLVCPQSYYRGSVTAEEQDFVSRLLAQGTGGDPLDPAIRFAGSVIDSNGLYYDQKKSPIGAVAARWWLARNKGSIQRLPAVNPCLEEADSQEFELANSVMIVPSQVETIGFRSATENMAEFADRIVMIGGTYGTEDIYRFRGVNEPHFGVTLHTWVLQDELLDKRQPSASFRVILDIVIGIFSGLLLSYLWGKSESSRQQYSKHVVFYALFMGSVLTLPAALIYGAVQSASLGITLGTAGMVISAMFDSLSTTKSASAALPVTSTESSVQGDVRSTWRAPVPTPFFRALVLAVVPATLLYLSFSTDSQYSTLWVGLGAVAGALAVCWALQRPPGMSLNASVASPDLGSARPPNWHELWIGELRSKGVQPRDSCNSALCKHCWSIFLFCGVSTFKIIAVLHFLTKKFSADVSSWSPEPALFLVFFALGCWWFDRQSVPNG